MSDKRDLLQLEHYERLLSLLHNTASEIKEITEISKEIVAISITQKHNVERLGKLEDKVDSVHEDIGELNRRLDRAINSLQNNSTELVNLKEAIEKTNENLVKSDRETTSRRTQIIMEVVKAIATIGAAVAAALLAI